jgi:regulator of PEP synthase PpsR (kinase-PPPase family)
MNKIISEINKIYKNYKNVEQSKLAKVVILDLIAEVNKRYGVMKRKEINDFYQIKKKYTNNIDDMNFNSVDYNILDDDNDYKLEGPSSKYKDLSMDASSTYNNKFATDDYSIIKEFR